METFGMLIIINLLIFNIQNSSAIDHPVRHRHSERRNKSSQTSKNAALSKILRLTSTNQSKESGKNIILRDSSVTQSDSSVKESGKFVFQQSVESDLKISEVQDILIECKIPNRLVNISTGSVNNCTKAYINNTIKTKHSNSVGIKSELSNDSKHAVFLTGMDKNNSHPGDSYAFPIDEKPKERTFQQQHLSMSQIYSQSVLNGNAGKRKNSNLKYHSVLEGSQSRLPLSLFALHDSKDGDHSQRTMFMRHNITVESLNHDNSEESESNKNTLAEKEEEQPHWGITIQEIASKQSLNNTSVRVYAPVGGDALLPCRVGHLGDRQVSWIRRRDWFVLTSGDSMYAHNERFVVLHEAGSQDWTLHIKKAVKGDSGMYECQVSTGTGIISFFVKLEVVTPTSHIPGNGRTHVYRGSPFTIFCYIVKSPSPIQHVMWYHNGEILNYQRERTDFIITTRVQKKPIPKDNKKGEENFDEGEFDENIDKNIIVSRLKVAYAEESHSGNYTCSSPNVQPDSTLIFVTEGDKTAAVQRIDSAGINDPSIAFIILNFMIIFITIYVTR